MNSKSYRLYFSKYWNSNWYSNKKNYCIFFFEGLELDLFVRWFFRWVTQDRVILENYLSFYDSVSIKRRGNLLYVDVNVFIASFFQLNLAKNRFGQKFLHKSKDFYIWRKKIQIGSRLVQDDSRNLFLNSPINKVYDLNYYNTFFFYNYSIDLCNSFLPESLHHLNSPTHLYNYYNYYIVSKVKLQNFLLSSHLKWSNNRKYFLDAKDSFYCISLDLLRDISDGYRNIILKQFNPEVYKAFSLNRFEDYDKAVPLSPLLLLNNSVVLFYQQGSLKNVLFDSSKIFLDLSNFGEINYNLFKDFYGLDYYIIKDKDINRDHLKSEDLERFIDLDKDAKYNDFIFQYDKDSQASGKNVLLVENDMLTLFHYFCYLKTFEEVLLIQPLDLDKEDLDNLKAKRKDQLQSYYNLFNKADKGLLKKNFNKFGNFNFLDLFSIVLSQVMWKKFFLIFYKYYSKNFVNHTKSLLKLRLCVLAEPTAKVISDYIIKYLKRGFSLNKIVYTFTKDLFITYPNLLSIKIKGRGRFTKRRRVKTYWFKLGKNLKFSDINSNLDYAESHINLKFGTGNVKVWLLRKEDPSYIIKF